MESRINLCTTCFIAGAIRLNGRLHKTEKSTIVSGNHFNEIFQLYESLYLGSTNDLGDLKLQILSLNKARIALDRTKMILDKTWNLLNENWESLGEIWLGLAKVRSKSELGNTRLIFDGAGKIIQQGRKVIAGTKVIVDDTKKRLDVNWGGSNEIMYDLVKVIKALVKVKQISNKVESCLNKKWQVFNKNTEVWNEINKVIKETQEVLDNAKKNLDKRWEKRERTLKKLNETGMQIDKSWRSFVASCAYETGQSINIILTQFPPIKSSIDVTKFIRCSLKFFRHSESFLTLINRNDNPHTIDPKDQLKLEKSFIEKYKIREKDLGAYFNKLELELVAGNKKIKAKLPYLKQNYLEFSRLKGPALRRLSQNLEAIEDPLFDPLANAFLRVIRAAHFPQSKLAASKIIYEMDELEKSLDPTQMEDSATCKRNRETLNQCRTFYEELFAAATLESAQFPPFTIEREAISKLLTDCRNSLSRVDSLLYDYSVLDRNRSSLKFNKAELKKLVLKAQGSPGWASLISGLIYPNSSPMYPNLYLGNEVELKRLVEIDENSERPYDMVIAITALKRAAFFKQLFKDSDEFCHGEKRGISWECISLVSDKNDDANWDNLNVCRKVAFGMIDLALSGEKRVLITSTEGKSRGATLLALYLCERLQVASDQALAFLRDRRPTIDPNNTFIMGLDIVSFNSIAVQGKSKDI